jgi:hypothetical protein
MRLPTFNELIRILRQGNEFLSRPSVSGLMVAKSGDATPRALLWGVMNRASMPFNMNVSLPPIEPAWLGVPLYFAKLDANGTTTATITPTGFALDRITKPKVNDAASFAAAAVRLYVFMTDGANWFVGGA